MDTGSALRWWLASALMALAFWSCANSTVGQTRPSSGGGTQEVTVLEAKGSVDIIHAERRNKARGSETLVPRDRLETFANSHATLLWYGNLNFQVSELTEITVPPAPEPKKRTVLQVFKGLLYFFHRDEPGSFEVQTPPARAVVLGTEFALRVEPGRTVLYLFDGEAEVSNPVGQTARVRSREQAVIQAGQPPQITPIVEAANDLIQWFLYYPGVLDPDDLGLAPPEEQALADSLAAYRAGDLTGALQQYPAGRQPASDAEKVYFAAVLLSVGQVDRAGTLLATLTPAAPRPASLAAGLRKLIAAVKGRADPTALDPQLTTCLLAESYYRQARADLAGALEAATNAAARAPRFGFAQARVAELEFSHGRTREARAALDRALALAPRNAQAVALDGFLLAAQNKISEALDAFDRAIALDGGLGNAWLGRGLCRIRRGDREAGRQDLQVAAALEPQRSLLRSYLGKAFHELGDTTRAVHELELARRLDPNDPTAPFYRALLEQQDNRINEAVRDLEESLRLNDNRRLYRSRLFLDEDRAVRGANLANIYRDAGLTDVSVREAVRAVNADYANFSAHLFLANSFNELRDPRQFNLRYETPWFSEYLLANLLAPVGAGTLSQRVSQQEYSKLFERDRLGLTSSTEYSSRGSWVQSAAQYGHFDNFGYAVEVNYRTDPGERPNGDVEQLTTSLTFKQQFTPADSLFFQATYYNTDSGDVAQYYSPTNARLSYRFHESQEPLLLAGYHREWAPWSHSLVLFSRAQDTLTVTNSAIPVLALLRSGGNVVAVPVAPGPQAALDYRNDLEAYLAEAQQITRAGPHTLILGGRFQTGTFETSSQIGESSTFQFGPPFQQLNFRTRATNTAFTTHFQRESVYGYDHWQACEPLLLTAGVSYDWLQYPVNFQYPPTAGGEREGERLSPKAGFIWTPRNGTTFRGAYTRSLGGVGLDQSFRLEPTQVGGFNQAFRSLIPEPVAGTLAGPRFETGGVAWDQKIGLGTYFGAQAEWLRSDVRRVLGTIDLTNLLNPAYVLGNTDQMLDYEERNLRLTFNQLIGDNWSLGAQYRVSDADLRRQFTGIPAGIASGTIRHEQAVLNQIQLFALFHHESGWFGRGEALWAHQANRGYATELPGDDFWQFNFYAGYRFPRRQAEVRLGLLNATDQDYHLNPLNLTSELPHRRTLTVSLLFNF